MASALLPRPEPRMTTLMPLDFAGGFDFGDEICRAETGQEGDEFYFRTDFFEGRALAGIEFIERVIASLAIDVGLQRGNFRVEPRRAENQHCIHTCERAESIGP